MQDVFRTFQEIILNKDIFHKTFIELTSRTYPYGTESQLDIFKYLKEYTFDGDNVMVNIGNSRTIFTSHLDTYTSTVEDIHHSIKGDFIHTDGSSILGADDKAGVLIMLYMIENKIPGNYIFFTGEERGGVSSRRFTEVPETSKWIKHNIDRIIAFDRGGYNQIVTSFYGTSGCSKLFAKNLKSRNFKISGKEFKLVDGRFCDATNFIDFVPECVNLSVGYFKEHTVEECVDMKYLYEIAKVYSNIEWELLTPHRNLKPILSHSEIKEQYVSILDYSELMLDELDGDIDVDINMVS